MSEEGQPQASSWRDRAVNEWRKQGLTQRLKTLLGDDVEIPDPHIGAGQSSVMLDGITFTLKADTGTLEVDAPCPRCHKSQHHSPIETSLELGRALDSLCRDCDFLVKSGMTTSTKG